MDIAKEYSAESGSGQAIYAVDKTTDAFVAPQGARDEKRQRSAS